MAGDDDNGNDNNGNNNNDNAQYDNAQQYYSAQYDYSQYGESNEGFEGYTKSGIDPSPWALVVTIGVSLLMIALIPLCVAIREKIRKRKRRRQDHQAWLEGQTVAETVDYTDDDDGDDSSDFGTEGDEYGLNSEVDTGKADRASLTWTRKRRTNLLTSAARFVKTLQGKRSANDMDDIHFVVEESYFDIHEEAGEDIFDWTGEGGDDDSTTWKDEVEMTRPTSSARYASFNDSPTTGKLKNQVVTAIGYEAPTVSSANKSRKAEKKAAAAAAKNKKKQAPPVTPSRKKRKLSSLESQENLGSDPSAAAPPPAAAAAGPTDFVFGVPPPPPATPSTAANVFAPPAAAASATTTDLLAAPTTTTTTLAAPTTTTTIDLLAAPNTPPDAKIAAPAPLETSSSHSSSHKSTPSTKGRKLFAPRTPDPQAPPALERKPSPPAGLIMTSQEQQQQQAQAGGGGGQGPPGGGSGPQAVDPLMVPFEKKVDINLCCGRRPWFLFLCSRRFHHKVAKCATWDKEMTGLLKLALPFTLQAATTHVFGLMEVAIIGRLLGTHELSAYYTVEFILSLSTMFMEGAHTSLLTLCSHAVGAEQYRLAGQYTQLAIIFYQVLLIPFAVFWWFFLDEVVEWLGFDDRVVEIGFAYAQVSFLQYFLSPYDESLHYLLEVTGHEVYTAVLEIAHSAVSFFSVLFVALYHEPTLWELGTIHLALQLFFFLLNAMVVYCNGWFHGGYWRGMLGTCALANRKAVNMFLRQAIPLSLGYVMSYGEWEVLFIFAGILGPAEVAAWGLVGTFWESIENVALAISDAAEVRVASLLGSGQPKRARYCAHKSLFVGVVFSILCTVPIAVFHEKLPAVFTKDETLQRLVGELLPYICVGNITMVFGSLAWTLLGAQGRFGLATAMGFVGSWGVTLPLAAISTLVLGLDLQGLVSSVVLGYSCSGALISYFLMRSNWEKLAAKIQEKNQLEDGKDGKEGGGAESAPDFDVYWDELPEHALLAAQKLGYTKELWNNDKEPASSNVEWRRLTMEQQEAAVFFGYTEEKWDNESDEESSSSEEE